MKTIELTGNYDTDFAAKRILEADVDLATEKLTILRNNGNPLCMGLTPDSIKFTTEFQRAKAEFDQAFNILREFNGKFLKMHKKEYVRSIV